MATSPPHGTDNSIYGTSYLRDHVSDIHDKDNILHNVFVIDLKPLAQLARNTPQGIILYNSNHLIQTILVQANEVVSTHFVPLEFKRRSDAKCFQLMIFKPGGVRKAIFG